MSRIEETKEEFIRVFRENITREGGDRFLEWLSKTDFFTAPASSKFHCACEGGLAMRGQRRKFRDHGAAARCVQSAVL